MKTVGVNYRPTGIRQCMRRRARCGILERVHRPFHGRAICTTVSAHTASCARSIYLPFLAAACTAPNTDQRKPVTHPPVHFGRHYQFFLWSRRTDWLSPGRNFVTTRTNCAELRQFQFGTLRSSCVVPQTTRLDSTPSRSDRAVSCPFRTASSILILPSLLTGPLAFFRAAFSDLGTTRMQELSFLPHSASDTHLVLLSAISRN